MTHTRAPHTRLCRHALLVLAATVGLCGPAAAVNRCTDAQGKVTFSDQPCPSDTQGGAIVVKPATGNAGPSTRSVRTYTPSNPPPATVSGKRARIAALDEAIEIAREQAEDDGNRQDEVAQDAEVRPAFESEPLHHEQGNEEHEGGGRDDGAGQTQAAARYGGYEALHAWSFPMPPGGVPVDEG